MLRNSCHAEERSIFKIFTYFKSKAVTSFQFIKGFKNLSPTQVSFLDCSAVDNLTFLNLSNNCLTEEMLERLKQLNVEVIAEVQKHPEERYCAVAEQLKFSTLCMKET